MFVRGHFGNFFKEQFSAVRRNLLKMAAPMKFKKNWKWKIKNKNMGNQLKSVVSLATQDVWDLEQCLYNLKKCYQFQFLLELSFDILDPLWCVFKSPFLIAMSYFIW